MSDRMIDNQNVFQVIGVRALSPGESQTKMRIDRARQILGATTFGIPLFRDSGDSCNQITSHAGSDQTGPDRMSHEGFENQGVTGKADGERLRL